MKITYDICMCYGYLANKYANTAAGAVENKVLAI